MKFKALAGCALALCYSIQSAAASPWAEVGDMRLRSDIEILAARGLVDGITTQWPLPWEAILARLSGRVGKQPDYVLAAVERVRAAAVSETMHDRVSLGFEISGTNKPNVVRGFESSARQDVQAQAVGEYMTGGSSLRLAVGARSTGSRDRQVLVLDNSYVAQEIGGAIVYAGYLPHWWGPGWVSALSLSSNARPMPQIGIARKRTTAFETPILSWFGAWQLEFMLGLLDGPRISENTLYSGLRVTLNPLPGLEIGMARTQMFCGKGHQCKPIAGYFNLSNDPAVTNYVNEEGVFDLRYTRFVGNHAFAVYAQVMNEDSDPISHSGSNHLFGLSTWLPVRGGNLRLTAEYTDSIATQDIFSFGNLFHGFAYNNYDYVDGMRYRNRTLGFSLDSDSRLASLQASLTNRLGNTFTLSLHRAQISTPENLAGNVVTTAPVTINLAELRISLPWRGYKIEIAGRIQDDQPRPKSGFSAAAEIALAYHF